jgi:hypothetical protein
VAIRRGELSHLSEGARASSYSAITAFHQVESFLSSLTDADLDGRIILNRAAKTKDGPLNEVDGDRITLRYMLLNPAEHFQSVIDEARCIVLAGGTMEPVRIAFQPRPWSLPFGHSFPTSTCNSSPPYRVLASPLCLAHMSYREKIS